MAIWLMSTGAFLYTSIILYLYAVGFGKVDHFKYYQAALGVATILIVLSLIGYTIVDWQYFDWANVK